MRIRQNNYQVQVKSSAELQWSHFYKMEKGLEFGCQKTSQGNRRTIMQSLPAHKWTHVPVTPVFFSWSGICTLKAKVCQMFLWRAQKQYYQSFLTCRNTSNLWIFALPKKFFTKIYSVIQGTCISILLLRSQSATLYKCLWI